MNAAAPGPEVLGELAEVVGGGLAAIHHPGAALQGGEREAADVSADIEEDVLGVEPRRELVFVVENDVAKGAVVEGAGPQLPVPRLVAAQTKAAIELAQQSHPWVLSP